VGINLAWLARPWGNKLPTYIIEAEYATLGLTAFATTLAASGRVVRVVTDHDGEGLPLERLHNLDPVILLAHEMGHAGAIMRADAPALAGLPTENAARLLMGCTRGRIYEYSRPPGCR
jgi:hypothetical protein